ncbi:diguanylate cyclase [Stenotrophomonas daejeonensis]|uniref:diguanylate cyclase n=1 Tax=Stenotrophomonas daejeonensis TaxID=659018 RepID=A0A0R0E145_9GAMM|nr:GGDEF domain-containing protein [Stenotrophomonas daejeonensis]KRG87557.1 diguanylate cyclase [Stenotrophomonas daejeonensis]
MTLDFPTIAIIGLLLHIGLAAGFSLILLVMRGHPVPRLWAASLWAGALGTTLLGLQGQMPELLSIVGRNAFAVLGSVLLLCGVALHVGRRAPLRPALVLAGGYMLCIVWFSVVTPDLGIRLTLYSLLVLLWKGWEVWLLLRHAPADIRRSCRIAAVVFVLDALLFLVRALLPVAPGAGGDILRAGLPMNVTYVGSLIVMMGHTFALVLLIVERQMVDLRRLARRDGLTGLLNRTALMDDGRGQLAQCQLRRLPFAVLLLDLDHFKRVNDSHGHQAGDAVLHHMARTLQRNLRGRDSLLGRYGGEEFVLLLPATSLEQAQALAERLRTALEACPLDSDIGPIAVTTSIGVAADVDATLERLLARADAALYRAKAAGRNRVVCDLGVEPVAVA